MASLKVKEQICDVPIAKMLLQACTYIRTMYEISCINHYDLGNLSASKYNILFSSLKQQWVMIFVIILWQICLYGNSVRVMHAKCSFICLYMVKQLTVNSWGAG